MCCLWVFQTLLVTGAGPRPPPPPAWPVAFVIGANGGWTPAGLWEGDPCRISDQIRTPVCILVCSVTQGKSFGALRLTWT